MENQNVEKNLVENNEPSRLSKAASRIGAFFRSRTGKIVTIATGTTAALAASWFIGVRAGLDAQPIYELEEGPEAEEDSYDIEVIEGLEEELETDSDDSDESTEN